MSDGARRARPCSHDTPAEPDRQVDALARGMSSSSDGTTPVAIGAVGSTRRHLCLHGKRSTLQGTVVRRASQDVSHRSPDHPAQPSACV